MNRYSFGVEKSSSSSSFSSKINNKTNNNVTLGKHHQQRTSFNSNNKENYNNNISSSIRNSIKNSSNNNNSDNEFPNQSNRTIVVDWKNLPLVILYKIFSYLTPTDRLNASTSCHSWRMVIYHQSLWPQKHLKVNLCPHKFVLSDNSHNNNNNNEQNPIEKTSGFHTYRLQDSFLYQQHLNVTSWLPLRSFTHGEHNNKHKKPNRKNFNEQLKSFIQKCSRFLNGITFYFDPNSSHNVLDLIKIIKYLSENEVAIYELNETRQNYYANCRNLKYFSIVPVRTLVRCASDQRFISLYSGLLEAVRFLFSKCNQLEHVSLGELHELIHATDIFFTQFFKTGVHSKLECLHLSSIKGDIFRYIPQRNTLDHLEKFRKLIYLSLDFDVLNTKVISILSKLNSLQTLSINVHRFNRNHSGISKEAWERIVNKLPNFSVNLNLLHTESYNFQVILDSLLNTQMPLKNFRAYYLEFKDENSPTILCNMLDVLSRVHMNTLESVTLVDNLNSPKNHLKAVSPNVLVMLSWRCRNLNNLTIIGYEITDIDIIAMARLRGESLQAFRFPASCIQLSQQFTKYNSMFNNNEFFSNFELASLSAQRNFRQAVSMPLKRSWQPIPTSQIPDIITTGFLPQITYHRTIIEQSCQCKH